MIKSGRSDMAESTGRYSGTTVVRNTAEKVLKNHGKNNGTGKFDEFVNKMHSMYKATLLDQDQLEQVMEREYKKMYESVDSMHESLTFSKGKWVVVLLPGRPIDRANFAPVKVESVSNRSMHGWAYGEHLEEYSTSSVKYVASSEADAENWIKKCGKMTIKEFHDKFDESVSPMHESATYSVSGNARDPALDTSDPAKAIEHWFKISRQAKMLASIHTLKEADGIKLFKWAAANPDKLTEWHKKYNCPYSIEYILEKTKHVADTSKLVGFVENKSAKEPWEGDMLPIFSAG